MEGDGSVRGAPKSEFTSWRLFVVAYQSANTIRPWGPHSAKTLSKNLLPLETALFPLTRTSVNYQFTCHRLCFSHRDSGCVNPARQNPHQVEPISNLQALFMRVGRSRANHCSAHSLLPAWFCWTPHSSQLLKKRNTGEW